jgi:hypothetical protein
MSGTSVSAFSADALTTNQAGRLTDQQRQAYRGQDRSFRKSELTGALGAIVFGILFLTAAGPNPNAWLRPLLAVVAFVIAGFLLFRATIASDSLSRDLSRGVVASVDGAILKNVRSSGGRSSSSSYYIHVAGKNFDVPRSVYLAAPDAGIVRVYFLPRSRTVVNLEQRPDRPLPASAASSPTEVVQALATGLRSRDLTQEAEAMAQMATLKKSFDQAAAAAAIAPPARELDPRPLAEAIVGTWQTGPISFTFAADGTMTTTLPTGQGQPGHWSVDSGRQLHAQFGGRDQVGEAWVAGDTLTIKQGGEGRQFQRASAG